MNNKLLTYPVGNKFSKMPEQLKIIFNIKAIQFLNKLTGKKTNSTEYVKYKTLVSPLYISLPMPNGFNVTLSHTWEETDTIKKEETIAKTFAGGASKQIFKQIGLGDKIAGILGGTSKYTAKVSHYEDTAPIEFTFDWKFTPKSKEEVVILYNITKMFQLGSMPKGLGDFANETVTLPYIKPPNLFDIKFIGNKKSGLAVKNYYFKKNTIKDMIITNVTTNYTPDGDFHPFEDGTPTSFDMSITFKQSQNIIEYKQIFGSTTLTSTLLDPFNKKGS